MDRRLWCHRLPAVLILALATAGCAASPGPPPVGPGASSAPASAPTSPDSTYTVPAAPPGLPDTAGALLRGCGTDKGIYPDAAPYQGKGPHPVVLGNGSVLPDGDVDVSEIQLVACTGAGSAGSILGYCVVNSIRIPVVAESVDITVYELRTGRLVDTLTITGDDAACDDVETLSAMESLNGGHMEFASVIRPGQYASAFNDLVNGDAG